MLRRFREDAPDARADRRPSLANGGRSRTERRALVAGVASGVIELVARHVAGDVVDWRALNDGRGLRKVALPTYPFEHRRYWLADEPPAVIDPIPQRCIDVTAVTRQSPLSGRVARASGRSLMSRESCSHRTRSAIACRLQRVRTPHWQGCRRRWTELSVTYIAEAFRSLGWEPVAGAAPDLAALGVVSEQSDSPRGCIAILRAAHGRRPADRAPRNSGAPWPRSIPAADAELTVLGRCAVAAGRRPPRHGRSCWPAVSRGGSDGRDTPLRIIVDIRADEPPAVRRGSRGDGRAAAYRAAARAGDRRRHRWHHEPRC